MKTSYETENEFFDQQNEICNESECENDEKQQSECVSLDVSQINDGNADIKCSSNYFALVSSLCVQRSMAVGSEVGSGSHEIPDGDVCESSSPAVPTVPPRVPKRVINTEETISPVIIPQEMVQNSSTIAEEPIELNAEEIIQKASVKVEEAIQRAPVIPEEVCHRASVIPKEVFYRRSANVEEVVQRLVDLETAMDNQRPEVASDIWSDTISQVPTVDDETAASDTDGGAAHYEPTSEMYYTASSEISLVSDEMPGNHDEDPKEKKECVTAGHVAAMRERFESMTRTNTPDFLRSSSPSPDVIRNITPSPDRLG